MEKIRLAQEGLGFFPTSRICPKAIGENGQTYGKGYSFPMLAIFIPISV